MNKRFISIGIAVVMAVVAVVMVNSYLQREKQKYVKEDKMRSFCGVIHVYNFLNDSFKYNRLNDVGNLVARIFVNKDKHFFVEGENIFII